MIGADVVDALFAPASADRTGAPHRRPAIHGDRRAGPRRQRRRRLAGQVRVDSAARLSNARLARREACRCSRRQRGRHSYCRRRPCPRLAARRPIVAARVSPTTSTSWRRKPRAVSWPTLSQRIGAAAGPISLMALLAAIVVVTNTVLVSVTQRTRDIGVRRAARRPPRSDRAGVLAESVLALAWRRLSPASRRPCC